MEEDRNHLIYNQEQPAETVLYPAPVVNQQRNSCGRGTAYSVFSVLVALLLAGQAVTVYFVYQQNNKISRLNEKTVALQVESLVNRFPKKSNSVNQLKMASMMIPMALREPSSASEDSVELSNSTEDQIKRLLLFENPTIKFPELKKSFSENMKHLKKIMNVNDWQSFEVWLHKWLLFQMAQNVIPEEKVKTKCQAEASIKSHLLGVFRPQCDEKGDYLPKQCHHSTGFCWCVYKNGTKIEGTEVHGPLDCSGSIGITKTTSGDTGKRETWTVESTDSGPEYLDLENTSHSWLQA